MTTNNCFFLDQKALAEIFKQSAQIRERNNLRRKAKEQPILSEEDAAFIKALAQKLEAGRAHNA